MKQPLIIKKIYMIYPLYYSEHVDISTLIKYIPVRPTSIAFK